MSEEGKRPSSFNLRFSYIFAFIAIIYFFYKDFSKNPEGYEETLSTAKSDFLNGVKTAKENKEKIRQQRKINQNEEDTVKEGEESFKHSFKFTENVICGDDVKLTLSKDLNNDDVGKKEILIRNIGSENNKDIAKSLIGMQKGDFFYEDIRSFFPIEEKKLDASEERNLKDFILWESYNNSNYASHFGVKVEEIISEKRESILTSVPIEIVYNLDTKNYHDDSERKLGFFCGDEIKVKAKFFYLDGSDFIIPTDDENIVFDSENNEVLISFVFGEFEVPIFLERIIPYLSKDISVEVVVPSEYLRTFSDDPILLIEENQTLRAKITKVN